MQNKPNSPKAKMDLTTYGKKDYGNICLRRHRKNKPNHTQFRTHRPRAAQTRINMQNKPNFEPTAFCRLQLELSRFGANMERQAVGSLNIYLKIEDTPAIS